MSGIVAEFIGGCLNGRHIVENARDEYRAVRRPNPCEAERTAQIHVYRKGVRHFSHELSTAQRERIVAERGEVVYMLERIEPLSPPPPQKVKE